MKPTPHLIPALARTAEVLKALAAGDRPATSSGLARQLGISQASCYRILQSLTELDWIQPDDEGGYEIAHGLVDLVRPLMGTQQLVDAAAPCLRDLTRVTDITCKLSILRGTEQVTLARAESTRPLSATGRVGSRFPVVQGSSGAALLSLVDDVSLDRILDRTPEDAWQSDTPDRLRLRRATCQKDGYCTNLGNHPQGLDTVSAPVASSFGPLAITLVGLRGDFDGDHLAVCTQAVSAAAADLAELARTLSGQG